MRKLVYEPKLIAHLNERYRDFETKEIIKRLQKIKKNPRSSTASDRNGRKPRTAA